jgi:hypothetical protein
MRIGVSVATSTTQWWTWLLGALRKMVDNGTIKPIRVEVSPIACQSSLFRHDHAEKPHDHMYVLCPETYRPRMYTLYTEAPTDSGGGVFARYTT